jgi:hypothetical protein
MAWELTGNAGTNPANNFLGTTDNQPLVIKIAGRECLRIDAHGNVGIATLSPEVKTQLEGASDPAATLAIRRTDNNKFVRLGVGTLGVALDFDSTSFLVVQRNTEGVGGLLAGEELLRVTADGRLGIGTAQPSTSLHVGGEVTLDAGNNPALYTGTGNVEQNRYLCLLNSLQFRSASGLRAGGVLIADDYSFANPGKNDLVVKGDAKVFGDVILSGGDCAEDFDVSESAALEPGAVVVINEEGVLEPCRQAYDKRVTGVISGAGDLRPGIILDKQPGRDNRAPVALLGKVCCKVDAGFGAIEVGDLLVASPTPAHAMKAGDPTKALGAVIGKALRGLASGRDLIPILVSLR